MRPTEAASPIWPMPTTSVESTSGPMIILMSFKKTAETSDMYLATSVAVALSGKGVVTGDAEPYAKHEAYHHINEVAVHAAPHA